MLRTRFLYAIFASLAVIALGAVYQALRPNEPPAPPSAILPGSTPAPSEAAPLDTDVEPAPADDAAPTGEAPGSPPPE